MPKSTHVTSGLLFLLFLIVIFTYSNITRVCAVTDHESESVLIQHFAVKHIVYHHKDVFDRNLCIVCQAMVMMAVVSRAEVTTGSGEIQSPNPRSGKRDSRQNWQFCRERITGSKPEAGLITNDLDIHPDPCLNLYLRIGCYPINPNGTFSSITEKIQNRQQTKQSLSKIYYQKVYILKCIFRYDSLPFMVL